MANCSTGPIPDTQKSRSVPSDTRPSLDAARSAGRQWRFDALDLFAPPQKDLRTMQRPKCACLTDERRGLGRARIRREQDLSELELALGEKQWSPDTFVRLDRVAQMSLRDVDPPEGGREHPEKV